jgi:hypothetical protein
MGRAPRKLRFSSKGERLPGPRHQGFLRTYFWTDEATKILGRRLSAKSIVQIELAIGRYVIEMEGIHDRLDAASVARSWGKLIKAIEAFRQKYEAVLADPETGKHIRSIITMPRPKDICPVPFWLDDEWWSRLDRAKDRISLELACCTDSEHSSSANPWDEWVVRRVASILRNEGFTPTAFSYESRHDRREPTAFVRFIAKLQAELPEWLGQHEPERAGHQWFSISKAVQRALRSKKS